MPGVQPWVTGPCEITVDGKDLGTCERFPRILVRSGWLPYFNDISGPVIPNDMLWAGKEAFIFLDLNRWDEDTLAFLKCITSSADPENDGLQWDIEDVATLMVHEEEAVEIRLGFPYSTKDKYAGMPAGYVFYAGWYEGPEEASSLGTNPRKQHVVLHCLPVLKDGKWKLGDTL